MRTVIILVVIAAVIAAAGGIFLFTAKSTAAQQPVCDDGVQFLAPPPSDQSWWAQYQAEIAGQVAGIQAFWSATLPESWTANPCTVEYDPATVPYQDSCGITPETAGSNAFYCSAAQPVSVVRASRIVDEKAALR